MASGIFDSVFRLGPLAISPHFFLESFAYLAGFAIYRREHQRAGDFLPTPDHTSLLVAAIIGAAVGSKLLAGFEDPASVNLLQSVESASCKLPGSFPLLRYFRRLGETETAKGLLIAAGIVFLLNAGCWEVVRSAEEHRRLSFIAFGGPQGQAGLSPAVARLGKLKLTPHQRGRRFCGISFSLSKRAELALALRAMIHSLASRGSEESKNQPNRY